MTRELLTPLRARFAARRPVRAGSLIVTLYGDCIQPRGGALWLGSLNQLMAPFGIAPGLVRTAMSRLVGEGWFERSRIGRNSHYRLSDIGASEFAVAAERIYSAGDSRWDGRLQLAVLTDGDVKSRQGLREAMLRHGWGQLAANVMARPSAEGRGTTADDPNVLLMTAVPDGRKDALDRLRDACWRLDALAGAYADLAAVLAPLSAATDAVRKLADADAFQLRLLLIHEWRRIVLRDPQLPPPLLPDDWVGARVRDMCRRIYLAARPGAERWLDAQAVDERGPLPPADTTAARRFAPT